MVLRFGRSDPQLFVCSIRNHHLVLPGTFRRLRTETMSVKARIRDLEAHRLLQAETHGSQRKGAQHRTIPLRSPMCESTEDCIDRDDRKSSKNLSAETDTEKTGIGIIFGRHLAGPGATLPYWISTVLTDGTAHKSGLIKAGDLLHEVNGVEVTDMTIEQITSLIMGQPSSAITITISTPDRQNDLPRLGYVQRTVLLNRKSSRSSSRSNHSSWAHTQLHILTLLFDC